MWVDRQRQDRRCNNGYFATMNSVIGLRFIFIFFFLHQLGYRSTSMELQQLKSITEWTSLINTSLFSYVCFLNVSIYVSWSRIYKININTAWISNLYLSFVSKFYILTLYQNSFLAILAFRYGHTQRKFTLITTLNPKLIIKKLYKKEETNRYVL